MLHDEDYTANEACVINSFTIEYDPNAKEYYSDNCPERNRKGAWLCNYKNGYNDSFYWPTFKMKVRELQEDNKRARKRYMEHLRIKRKIQRKLKTNNL